MQRRDDRDDDSALLAHGKFDLAATFSLSVLFFFFFSSSREKKVVAVVASPRS
jgi:hypothetical protein